GKKYMLSLTWNAPKEAFDNTAQVLFQGKTAEEVFISNTAVYKFCGAEILPSFSCYDVLKNPDIEAEFERMKAHLKKIVD
ncbi:MAG: NAD(P)H-dependent oxidoreductase, partial [Candidatus Bathyarchaeota archaeon]|nr:NAD(P)H-dependent oxidoreductase [Candidatus Bathyarchaeota archaeon]